MLRNRRGATSLRWLRALLDHGVEVHGQVVCCPGVNDGDVLADTLTGVLDRYPELASLCVVPLGVSRHNTEARMRPTTRDEAATVVDLVHEAQERFLRVLGRRLVFAADEYYLLAERPFPEAEAYEGFAMHEDGVGMARTFELELLGDAPTDASTGPQAGFFSWVDAGESGRTTRYEAAGDLGAPAEGYRAVRCGDAGRRPAMAPSRARRRRSPSPSALGSMPPSASSPARTEPACSARCSGHWDATTCAWSRSRTATSAATSPSPA